MPKRGSPKPRRSSVEGGAAVAGKRKKKDGQQKGNPGTIDTTEADKATPKSIIIYRGEVGPKLRGLMHEWRRVFMPWSSKRLNAKSGNTIKDFVSVAATLSVSHLQLLSAPPGGASLRILRFSNGPTLTFRIDSFALRDDIPLQKKPAPINGAPYDIAPVVVLSNFAGSSAVDRPEVTLMESTFQNMFPSVNVHTMAPSSIQRVVLFRYDAGTETVEVRHYYIDAKAVGLSRTVKRLLDGRVPSRFGTLDTVDEVLDKEGAWSDTDGEGEEVALPSESARFRAHRGRCRVKLSEIGPRLTLSLVKVEAGFGGGEVIYHRHERKTPQEQAETAKRVRSRANEKTKRRREQEAHVDDKKKAKEEKMEAKKRRRLDRERQLNAERASSDDEDDGRRRAPAFEEVASPE